MEETTKIAIFKGKQIRKIIYNNEWWFVIVDVVSALTDSVQPEGYIKDMRRCDLELSKGWGQITTPLSVRTVGGMQKVNCANTEGVFRIIQSIPSPKAEPFKRWLAKTRSERTKGLKRENLRDHMDDFELIFTMLGERSTTEIHRQENSKGVPKLKADANRGGKIAGVAKKELEKELGRSIVSKGNFLPKKKVEKLLKS